MKLRSALVKAILPCAALLSACAAQETPFPETVPPPTAESSEGSPPTANGIAHWAPPVAATWQIQFSGELDTGLSVDIFFLDLFDTPAETIASLRARGVKVVCYFSAGTYEDWRPDAASFSSPLLGKDLPDWPGETWLDIRDLESLAPIMLARIGLAAQKGCDGVDPDNVDGFANDSGFPLTADDQLAYNIFLANAAHQNGLAIGLKNDLQQIPQLAPFFDWALNEQCFYFEECDLLLPFVNAGKPVFVIEYELSPEEFCSQANDMNFNAMQKNLELDDFRFPCR
ncbi:MAG: endo alpha-1,4 polygalactosaminidase [Chloroflexota bacterium]